MGWQFTRVAMKGFVESTPNVPIVTRVASPLPSRPCRVCLALQHDSVFADFDLDAGGQLILSRISFDGFGCCAPAAGIRPLEGDHSRRLLEWTSHASIEDPEIELILRAYFRANEDVLWSDALREHGLV
jgi:hypothetical protein